MFKFRKRVIAADAEGTYGADATPTAALNAMQVSNFELTSMELETVERDYVGLGLGSRLKQIVDTKVMASFEVDLAASGTVGVAPAWGPLMRGCGMAQAVNVGVDVRFTEVDENEESITIYVWLGPNLHPITGLRGSWGYKVNAKQPTMITMSFEGLFGAPVNATHPTADFSAWKRALVANTSNTTLSIHGNNHVFAELSYDHANQITKPALVGREEIQINDRTPSGSVKIEAPDVATLDYYSIIAAETLGLVQVVHGTTAGQIVTIQHPQTQLLSPGESELEGIAMLDMGLNPIPSVAGNDSTEIILT